MISQEQRKTYAAARVVQTHAAAGGCAQCTGDGCRLWTWADARLRQWQHDYGPLPASAPDDDWAWSPSWALPAGR